MLKKIVKYGNSCAIILDKALLELLDMAEGSIVKIKTDGVSLTITPQNPLVQELPSPTLTVESAREEVIRKSCEMSLGVEKGSAYYKEYQEIMNKKDLSNVGTELKSLLKKYGLVEDLTSLDQSAEAFKKVHEKYSHVLQAMTKVSDNPEYIHETMLLAEKHQLTKGQGDPQNYFEETTKLISKYLPEYGSYQKELKEVAESLNKK